MLTFEDKGNYINAINERGEICCRLQRYNKEWLPEDFNEDAITDADYLHQIADKLDELNANT